MLPSVVGTWAATPCHQREVGEPIYVMRGSCRTAGPLSYYRLHRLRRPGDGTSAGRDDQPRPEAARLPILPDHTAATSLPKRNSLPSTQRRCRTVASLRASATLARRMPRRLATSSAQRLRVENLPARVSITFAASYSAVRTIASPALLIPPVTSVSPDWYFFGASPKCAPTARERWNRAGSSIAEAEGDRHQRTDAGD